MRKVLIINIAIFLSIMAMGQSIDYSFVTKNIVIKAASLANSNAIAEAIFQQTLDEDHYSFAEVRSIIESDLFAHPESYYCETGKFLVRYCHGIGSEWVISHNLSSVGFGDKEIKTIVDAWKKYEGRLEIEANYRAQQQYAEIEAGKVFSKTELSESACFDFPNLSVEMHSSFPIMAPITDEFSVDICVEADSTINVASKSNIPLSDVQQRIVDALVANSRANKSVLPGNIKIEGSKVNVRSTYSEHIKLCKIYPENDKLFWAVSYNKKSNQWIIEPGTQDEQYGELIENIATYIQSHFTPEEFSKKAVLIIPVSNYSLKIAPNNNFSYGETSMNEIGYFVTGDISTVQYNRYFNGYSAEDIRVYRFE